MGRPPPEIIFLSLIFLSIAECRGRPGRLQCSSMSSSEASRVASVSLDLTGSVPAFMDTSAFLFHRGITRYVISRVPEPSDLPNTCPDPAYYVADDFQFVSASLAELCPCDGSWRNHAEYVRCVRAAVSLFVEDAALTREQARDIIKDAQHTDCGH
jgi:hypothetical protein